MSKGKIIYGGSFNPLHIGHMRLAVQALEILANVAETLDFVPVGLPPHKNACTLLPFDLRVKMIRQAIKDQPRMRCNDLEGKRPGASYTFDTLHNYLQKYSKEDLYFLLGSMDYKMLPQWHRGMEFPELCNLAVAPRGDFTIADFEKQTINFWPGAQRCQDVMLKYEPRGACMRLPQGTMAYYLDMPYLEISASIIRGLWLTGRSIEYLMPPDVIKILEEEKETALTIWQEKTCF